MNRWIKRLSIGLVLGLSLFAVTGCGDKGDQVVVGGKDFTEQDILVNLVAEMIEANSDIQVERKPYLGGSSVVASAMEVGDVDVMVEYTGTGLMSVLGEPVMNDSQKVFEKVQKGYQDKFDIQWLAPLGFNNTFAITMTEDKAQAMGIKTLSDLKDHASSLRFASTHEFLERVDGYEALKEAYGIDFKDVKGMDPGLCYTALHEDQADVSISFATDGRIPAFDFRILEDDKAFFPPYDASVLVRNESLEKHPELKAILERLSGQIDDAEMAKLNAKVDIDKADAQTVAKAWLKEKGLIQ